MVDPIRPFTGGSTGTGSPRGAGSAGRLLAMAAVGLGLLVALPLLVLVVLVVLVVVLLAGAVSSVRVAMQGLGGRDDGRRNVRVRGPH